MKKKKILMLLLAFTLLIPNMTTLSLANDEIMSKDEEFEEFYEDFSEKREEYLKAKTDYEIYRKLSKFYKDLDYKENKKEADKRKKKADKKRIKVVKELQEMEMYDEAKDDDSWKDDLDEKIKDIEPGYYKTTSIREDEYDNENQESLLWLLPMWMFLFK